MKLSRIWRTLQTKEGVIHRGRRLRWITPSEICRILHTLRNLTSIIALNNIHSKYFPIFTWVSPFCYLFYCSPNITQLCPQIFSVNSSIICSRLHFPCHFDIIGSTWHYFWHDRFNMTKFFSNLVNSSWVWWIMHMVLINQKCRVVSRFWVAVPSKK